MMERKAARRWQERRAKPMNGASTMSQSTQALTKDAVVRVLREHVSTVVRAEKGGVYIHDAVCAACNAPLPWGEDQRLRAVRSHQADVILELVSEEPERCGAVWEYRGERAVCIDAAGHDGCHADSLIGDADHVWADA